MNSHRQTPHVLVRPAPNNERIARARWDDESSTFSCAIEFPGELESDRSLRERIDALLHVESPERRLTLGDVDMSLDGEGRLTSLEFYGNPARWVRVTAEPIERMGISDVSLELCYDVNGIASVDVPVTIEHDISGGILTLRFGEQVGRWVEFARGLSIGVSSGRRLAAIRIHPFAPGGR